MLNISKINPSFFTQEHHDDDPEYTPRMLVRVDDLIGRLTYQPHQTPSPDFDDGDVSVVSAAGSQTTQKGRGRPRTGPCEKPKPKASRSRSSKHAADDAANRFLRGSHTKNVPKQTPKGFKQK